MNDSAAFSRLYEGFHLVVFRYVYSLHGGPREAVEDLTAETFTKAWRARRSFQGDERAAKSWLLQIAHNLVVDALRRQAFRGHHVDVDDIILPDLESTPEKRAEERHQLSMLVKAMQTLSIEQRQMLTLRYVLAWRVKDIGQHLGIPENTVSVVLRRSLARLRESWPASEES